MTTTKTSLDIGRELVRDIAAPDPPTTFIVHATIGALRHAAAPGLPPAAHYTDDQVMAAIEEVCHLMHVTSTEYIATIVGKALAGADMMTKADAKAVAAALERQLTGH